MKAVFIELPAFERHRRTYLDDHGFAALQSTLMTNPAAESVIEGTGGLRKLRQPDARRGKGKRGGLRIIYYYCVSERQFLLFAIYDKSEASDLSEVERRVIKAMLEADMRTRRSR